VARRYPLAPLLGIRRERVEERALSHRVAARQSETQAATAHAAREKREGTERALGAERANERRRLEAGAARVQDLQQGERHRVGEAARLRSLRAREDEARERARSAERVQADARVKLGRARADEKATAEHARRFHRAGERADERVQEEASLDQWSASRRGARSR
jgi:hypothetical protein